MGLEAEINRQASRITNRKGINNRGIRKTAIRMATRILHLLPGNRRVLARILSVRTGRGLLPSPPKCPDLLL